MKTKFEIEYFHADSLDDLSPADRELVTEAENAVKKAYAAYSKFSVGAAARLKSGKILHGANSESEVFPSGICAERSLLYYAEANYPDDKIESLAIASNPSERECYPCGACRQVMREFNIKTILLGNMAGAIKICTLEELLPYGFDL